MRSRGARESADGPETVSIGLGAQPLSLSVAHARYSMPGENGQRHSAVARIGIPNEVSAARGRCGAVRCLGQRAARRLPGEAQPRFGSGSSAGRAQATTRSGRG